jgi:hypothetical protein
VCVLVDVCMNAGKVDDFSLRPALHGSSVVFSTLFGDIPVAPELVKERGASELMLDEAGHQVIVVTRHRGQGAHSCAV